MAHARGSIYALSYLAFALLWFLVASVHRECLLNVRTFNEAFLLSVETQSTIGYGVRAVAGNCVGATFLEFGQTVCGMLLDAGLLGLMFAKMARPQQRKYTLLFSDKVRACVIRRAMRADAPGGQGCVYLRNGQLCLVFRVGDLRTKAPFANPRVGGGMAVLGHDTPTTQRGPQVRVVLLYDEVTAEGEVVPFQQANMAVGSTPGAYADDSSLLLPKEIVHVVDEASPVHGRLSLEVHAPESCGCVRVTWTVP